MARIPKPDPIDLILDYELPLPPSKMAIMYANAEGTNLTDAEISRLESKRQKRRAALQKLNATKLASKAKIARNGLIKQRNEAAKNREKRAFFNQPSAKKPDYKHWGRLAIWTLEEAAALMMGRAPKLVNWKRLEYRKRNLRDSNFPASPFVSKYQKVREAIHRAQIAGQLNNTISPPDFVAWADAKGFRIPKPLLRAVTQSNQASAVVAKHGAATEDVSHLPAPDDEREVSEIVLAYRACFPDGKPPGMQKQRRNDRIRDYIREEGGSPPSDRTIRRHIKKWEVVKNGQ